MMKNRIIISTVLFIIPLFLMAQGQGRRYEEAMERFKSERVSYLTERMVLTVDEAEKFWPVYNEYQEKKDKIMREGRPQFRRPDEDSLSDDQMKKLMANKFKSELQEAELAQKYHKKFLEVLPVKKVFILYRAEHDFMGMMIRKMRSNGQIGEDKEGKRSRK